ncbi:SDR family oxidoreductase [Candidatus Curtissbacteria bacterium]|nr:SDR family oxidoreductase [Candidatus Curtissbacteria bacterium]
MRQTIGVIGSGSMVGSRFCEIVEKDFGNISLLKADHHANFKIDITDRDKTRNFFQNHFDWLILFAAFTDVDAAEKQRGDKIAPCWQINVEGTTNVADACLSFGKNLIFISTDFVFDGTNGPYSEDDTPGPDMRKTSWYGITKIEAEKRIRQRLKDYLIVRIAYPYRGPFAQKDDIIKRILKLYQLGQLYPIFTDQKLTPTFIDDLAPAINLLVRRGERGIFHLASPKITTQYQFAKFVIATFGGDPRKVPKGSARSHNRDKSVTPRPTKGGLKVDKIKKLGFTPTNWQEGIRKIYEQSNGQLI